MNVVDFILKAFGLAIVGGGFLFFFWFLWTLGYESLMFARKQKQLTRLFKLRADALEDKKDA